MNPLKIIQDEIRSILEATIETALKDGQITTDESQIIETLKEHLLDLENELRSIIPYLDESLNEIEIRERTRLVARTIIPQLTKVAEDDGVITADEAALLSRILNEIMD